MSHISTAGVIMVYGAEAAKWRLCKGADMPQFSGKMYLITGTNPKSGRKFSIYTDIHPLDMLSESLLEMLHSTPGETVCY